MLELRLPGRRADDIRRRELPPRGFRQRGKVQDTAGEMHREGANFLYGESEENMKKNKRKLRERG
jgi:hypothetical protein